MKIITYDRFKPGVTMETIAPYPPEEVSNVWRLWKAGIVRENYARSDELGVVIDFECDSLEQCKRYTDDFPLTRAGFLEWIHLPPNSGSCQTFCRDQADVKNIVPLLSGGTKPDGQA